MKIKTSCSLVRNKVHLIKKFAKKLLFNDKKINSSYKEVNKKLHYKTNLKTSSHNEIVWFLPPCGEEKNESVDQTTCFLLL